MNHRPLANAPDPLDLHRLDPARYPVLLESSSGGALGRLDLLLAHAGEGFVLHRDGRVRRLDGAPLDGRFLDVLDAHWQA
ncbi:MAG TPA: aminodeoxychorismate synthase, component I, partial [Thermomonas sp.]|nr:aminodeoxychorismate synthase, component I [Thermomonas sp.]